MAKTTPAPTTKRGMIELLAALNADIGANKALIETYKESVVEHMNRKGAANDADIKNYMFYRIWAYEYSINKCRVELEADLNKRAEIQKQLAAKVVNILTRRAPDDDVKYYRWLARSRLKDKGVIDDIVLETVLEAGRSDASDGRYEVQFEMLVTPNMEAQIVSVDYGDVDEAIAALKTLKAALGDMVIVVKGYVSADYHHRKDTPAEILIAANHRLADKISALESDWVN